MARTSVPAGMKTVVVVEPPIVRLNTTVPVPRLAASRAIPNSWQKASRSASVLLSTSY